MSDNTKRDGFNSRVGFVMACIGSAVGMGNLWRFPIMVSIWGGMDFLIPYFICIFLISQSGVIGEMALGRSAGAGPMGAFGMATQRKFGNKQLGEGIGLIPVLGSLALAIGYSCVVGWIIKYFYLAVTGGVFALGNDMDAIGGLFGSTASAGGNNLWLVIALIVNFSIMALGVAGGIEKANKFMMPILFFLFVGLGIYIATLPGAADGYKYIFTLNVAKLANPLLWIFAFGQAFFSLSVAGNGTVIYGSYLSKSEDIVSSARIVAIFDTIAALLAAFVILPAMAAGGVNPSEGGPGLMFIYLINIFNRMPGGLFVGIIFYTCVLFAGISSLVNLYEAPIATLQEKLGMKRVIAVVTIGVLGAVVALAIQGIVGPWMDVVSNYICPLGAFLAAVMFFWICGDAFVINELKTGAKGNVPTWILPLSKYVYTILCIIALIAGVALGGIG